MHKISVVGGELLKRFNIIIDIQAGRLYLKPGKAFGSDWPVARKAPEPSEQKSVGSNPTGASG